MQYIGKDSMKITDEMLKAFIWVIYTQMNTLDFTKTMTEIILGAMGNTNFHKEFFDHNFKIPMKFIPKIRLKSLKKEKYKSIDPELNSRLKKMGVFMGSNDSYKTFKTSHVNLIPTNKYKLILEKIIVGFLIIR